MAEAVSRKLDMSHPINRMAEVREIGAELTLLQTLTEEARVAHGNVRSNFLESKLFTALALRREELRARLRDFG